MPSQERPDPPPDFADLRALSADFGADPMHIQGAGGNSSVKAGDVLWIKASGTMLADARTQDVFVATDLPRMQAALQAGDPRADRPADFLLPGGPGLRPSIETSLHAVLPHRVVLHTHCVHTLAHAIRADAEALLHDRLTGFDWAYVGYTKPGANLARQVHNVLGPETDVIVLGNHGLIVAGDSVDAVRRLQHRVHDALALAPAADLAPDLPALRARADGSAYHPPADPVLHQLALPPQRAEQVTRGSLYPDHVIFCGIAVPALRQNERAAEAEARIRATGAPAPVWLLVPGAGVLARNDLSSGARVMMRCLADVMARVPPDTALNYLTAEQNLELLNWDAEKYRQSLNAS